MGTVWKRGQFNTAFRRRFLVLDNGILRYYRDQRSFISSKKWLGGLSCDQMTVEEDLGRHDDRFLFTVTDARGRRLQVLFLSRFLPLELLFDARVCCYWAQRCCYYCHVWAQPASGLD